MCRKNSMAQSKMCRKFSVGKSSVENFPWETEKCSVDNFLSKIVMFALQCISDYVSLVDALIEENWIFDLSPLSL